MRMLTKLTPIVCLLALSFGAHAAEGNKVATAAYEHGVAVLTQGDFAGAMASFKEAAKADPENKTYPKELALVSRVRALRATLPKVHEDAVKWEKMASSLRAYYLQHEIFGEAVAIDQERYERFQSTDVAIDLAESYLERYDDVKSVKVLAKLKREERTVRANVMLGIGLARTHNLDGAKKLSGSYADTEDADPQLLYDQACLLTLVGDLDLAAAKLTACFEAVPAGPLATLKRYSETRRDLAGLRNEKFASVWKVESKVKSGGCAGCSSADSCGSKGDCDDEEKKDCEDDKDCDK